MAVVKPLDLSKHIDCRLYNVFTTLSASASRPCSIMECSQPAEGQQSGVFTWRPELRSYQENRPIPTRLFPKNCAPGRGRDLVSSMSSPRNHECARHLPICDQSSAFCPEGLPTTIFVPSPTTRAPTTINPSSFHAQL